MPNLTRHVVGQQGVIAAAKISWQLELGQGCGLEHCGVPVAAVVQQRLAADVFEITAHTMAHPHGLRHTFIDGVDVAAEQPARQKVQWRKACAGWECASQGVGPQRFVDAFAAPVRCKK